MQKERVSHLRSERSDVRVPSPSSINEPLRRVLQHHLVPLEHVHRLVGDLLAECAHRLRLNRSLQELGQRLDGLLQVTLVVLEDLLLVTLLCRGSQSSTSDVRVLVRTKVVTHRVRPLERHSALDHLVHRLLCELDLDPSELGRLLHLLHLLLRLGVQVEREASRLLVVGPSVVVLRGLVSHHVRRTGSDD